MGNEATERLIQILNHEDEPPPPAEGDYGGEYPAESGY
jgi:hypothetical protein